MNIKDRVKVTDSGEVNWGGAQGAGAGTYVAIIEKVEFGENEEKGQKWLNFTHIVTDENSEYNERKFFSSIFCTGEDWMKERAFDQLCAIIDFAGATEYFSKRYAKYDSLIEEEILENVADDLNTKVVGKPIAYTTEMRKSKDGKERLNIKSIAKAGKGGAAASGKKKLEVVDDDTDFS